MKPGGSMLHLQRLSNNPYPEPNQFLVLIPIYLRSILIVSSHLRLGLPKGQFPAGVPVKISKELLPSSILAIWLVHLNLLDLITILGGRYKLLHSPFSSLLGPNTCLRTLFSNTLCFSSLISTYYTYLVNCNFLNVLK